MVATIHLGGAGLQAWTVANGIKSRPPRFHGTSGQGQERSMYRGTLTTRAGRLAFVLLPLSLLACSGGGGDGDGAVEGMCQAIGGGASEFSATPAPNASFTNEGNIFDGDLGSFG